MIVLMNMFICALRKMSALLLPGGIVKYTLGTMANPQTDRAPTEINKNGAVVKSRISVELGILQET